MLQCPPPPCPPRSPREEPPGSPRVCASAPAPPLRPAGRAAGPGPAPGISGSRACPGGLPWESTGWAIVPAGTPLRPPLLPAELRRPAAAASEAALPAGQRPGGRPGLWLHAEADVGANRPPPAPPLPRQSALATGNKQARLTLRPSGRNRTRRGSERPAGSPRRLSGSSAARQPPTAKRWVGAAEPPAPQHRRGGRGGRAGRRVASAARGEAFSSPGDTTQGRPLPWTESLEPHRGPVGETPAARTSTGLPQRRRGATGGFCGNWEESCCNYGCPTRFTR